MLDPIPTVPNVIKLFSTSLPPLEIGCETFRPSNRFLPGTQKPTAQNCGVGHQPKQFSPKTNNREICSAIILPLVLWETLRFSLNHPAINYLRLAAFPTNNVWNEKVYAHFLCPKITALKLLRISTKRITLGPFFPFPGIARKFLRTRKNERTV